MFCIFVLASVIPVSASDPTVVNFLNEDVEFGLEVIIAFLAVMASLIALKVRNDVKGGQLESAFNYFALASLTFAVLEIYQIVKGLWFKVTGLGDIIEIVFVVFLIIGFNKAREALK